MKIEKILLGVALLLMLITGPSAVSGDLPSGLVVTMDAFHRDFFDDHSKSENLDGNLTAAGSTFNLISVNDTWALPADTDVLLMPGTDVAFKSSESTAIIDWFESDGPKLFWAAGDSDFSGFFDTGPLNTLLADLGADLRLGAESIEDPTVNDGAAYRVASSGIVKDGVVNAQINEGLSDGIITHGPAPVLAEEDGEIVDIREVNGVEVLIETSSSAVAIDSDLSETLYDYYAINKIAAPFPMVAIQDLGNGKWVIVSGEAVFSDYKLMYGEVTETGSFNNGKQDGSEFVNGVLHWFSSNGDSDKLKSGFLPFNFMPFLVTLVVIVTVYKRRR